MMKAEKGTLTLLKSEGRRFFKFFLSELKPKGKILTPFNITAAIIIITGLVLIAIRFATGLGYDNNGIILLPEWTQFSVRHCRPIKGESTTSRIFSFVTCSTG